MCLILLPILILFLILRKTKIWITDILNKKTNHSLFTYLKSIIEQNTEYEIECLNCDYHAILGIGGSHTSDLEGHFETYLVYCPRCKELLHQNIITYPDNPNKNSITNKNCTKCGTKTVKYDVLQNKLRIKCSKCGNDKIKITDKKSFWVT